MITVPLSLALAGVTAAAGLAVVPTAAAAPGRTALLPRAEAKARPVLRRGDRSIWVRRVNTALQVEPARKVFRRKTARAVEDFRALHGLKPRPVVGTRVWRLLGDSVPLSDASDASGASSNTGDTGDASVVQDDRPELSRGDTSAWVRAVQTVLGVQPTSGYFGPLTEAAVKRFQIESGLAATGVVAAATWAALGDDVAAPTADPTMTASARDSRQYRAGLGVSAFVASWSAQTVVQRESNGQCDVVSSNGAWRGKWQMDAAFWSHYGGTRYAPTPDAATCGEQDTIAYAGWVDRWWAPWRTATFPD